MPRILGRIRRRHAVEVRDVEFLRANTDRRIKITLPGPFTLSMQAKGWPMPRWWPRKRGT